MALRLAVAAMVIGWAVTASGDGGFQTWMDATELPTGFRHALGPHHVITTRTGEIRFFTRAGELTHEQETGLWDQSVMFDPLSRRFLLAGFGGDCGGAHCITLAVSDDEDPNGPWASEAVDVGELLGPQYEGNPWSLELGLDDEYLWICWDSMPALVQDRRSWALVIDRASLISGPVTLVNAFQTSGLALAYAPSKAFGNPPSQYLVTTFGQPVGTSRLTFLAVRDPLGIPVLDTFVMDVPPFEHGPHAVPNLVLPNGIDSTESALLRAVYRDGSLWLAHHGKPAGQSRVLAIWYEIALNGWPVSGGIPEIRQTGVIDPGPGIHTWIPDLAVDAEGGTLFSYARSAADQLHAAGWSYRHPENPPGVFQHGVVRVSDPVAVFSPVPTHHAYNSSVAEDPDFPGLFSAGGTYRRENQWGGVSRAMWVVEAGPAPIFEDGFESGDSSAWSVTVP